MDEHFNNIDFWQIAASCSKKKLTSRDMFFAKRNNILTQESLCTLQLPIFEFKPMIFCLNILNLLTALHLSAQEVKCWKSWSS